jgi:hypothetical protein
MSAEEIKKPETPILDGLFAAIKAANDKYIEMANTAMNLGDKLEEMKELPQSEKRDKDIALLEKELPYAVKARDDAMRAADAARLAEITASGPEVEAERAAVFAAWKARQELLPKGWTMYDE